MRQSRAMTETELQLIKRRDAAKLLACSTRTVQRMERDGKLRGIKLSTRATCYRLCDIHGLINGGGRAYA